MKLFCLPHAGGSAVRIARAFGAGPGGLEPVPLELPGRGERWREPVYVDWSAATYDLAQRLVAELDHTGYALFGHSFGALLAYEVAVWLRDIGAPPPSVLVVSGRNPPHLSPEATPFRAGEMSDEELFAALVALGGAARAAAGPLTYRTFLPALREDLRLVRRYAATAGRRPLDVPLLVLYGRQDPLTAAAVMGQWSRYTSAGCQVHPFAGGHFFMLEQAAQVAAVIGRGAAVPALAAEV